MLSELNAQLRKPLNLLPWRLPGKVASLIGVCLAAATCAGISYEVFDLPLLQARVLLVTLAALGLWITEAIPPFAVSLAVVAAQVFFLDEARGRATDLTFSTYTQAWTSPVIWLMLGGFVLALGMSITRLDRIIALRLIAITKGSTRGLIAVFLVIASVLSMFMSNTATTALLVSIASPILTNAKADRALIRAVLLSIATGATIGGLGTIIGSSPNALALAHFSANKIPIDFLRWMKVGVPLVFMILLPVFFLLTWRAKLPKVVELSLLQEGGVNDAALAAPDRLRIAWQRRIVLATFLLTIGLWMTSPLHSWSISAIAFLPVVSFSVTGIVRDQHIRQLPWDTLLFVMGGIVLGQSVSESGLASSMIGTIPFAGLSPLVVLFGAAYVTMLLSNFLSNTATAALLIPLAAAIMPERSGLPTLVISLAASTSLLLPISTPTNAVVYATGLLDQRDFHRTGLLVGLVGPALIVVVCWMMDIV